MGKEAKIGLAVILGLLILFGVVLTRRLIAPSDDPGATASGEKERSPAAEAGNTDANATAVASFATPSRPTVVAARPILAKTPPRSTEASQWSVISPNREIASGPRAGQSEAVPPTFMPSAAGVTPPDVADRDLGEPPALPPLPAEPAGPVMGAASAGDPAQDPFQARSPGGAALSSAPDYRQTARPTNARPSASGTVSVRQVPVSDSRYSTIAQPGGLTTRHDDVLARRPDGTYVVQPNDSYWTISEKIYGAGAYFKALAEHNRGKRPREDRLQVGDTILAPSLQELEKRYPELCPKPSHREAVRSQTSLVSTRGALPGRRTYVVEEGDNLFNIARSELGKASRWVEIHELNRDLLGEDFDYLRPGLQLVLPDDGRSADSVTRRQAPSPPLQR